MKNYYSLFVIVFYLIVNLSFCQTSITGGEVFGTWTKDSSPYLIEGAINIPIDQTLIIEPGVKVQFNGHYMFIIYGCLMAQGNENDSIIFTSEDIETGWHGLRFTNTTNNNQAESIISFSIIEHGKAYGTCPDNSGGGIYVGHSAPTISNNTIRYNSSTNGAGDWGGGGIYNEYGRPVISYNLIMENYSGHDGGGIYSCYTNPIILENRIINNEAAFRGGGIATFTFSSPNILSNEIKDNQASNMGGGIYQSGGSSLIQGNIINNNYAGDGGGIACYLSNPRIYNNLLTENEAYRGAGIWNHGSSPNIFNNTVVDNSAYNSGGGMYNLSGMIGIAVHSKPLTANNIFYQNIAEEGLQIYSITNNIPILWHNNIEGLASNGIFGDYNQQEGNMDMDPSFDMNAEHDCELSQQSGCVDHGINMVSGFELPETDILGNIRIWNGDGIGSAIVDMGAYEYGSTGLGILDPNMGLNHFNLILYPNPMIKSLDISFDLKKPQRINISIYQLNGKRKTVLLNENLNQGEHQMYFELKGLSTGAYILSLESETGEKSTSSFIKITH